MAYISYTESQISRMIEKLRNTPDKTPFKLNPRDPKAFNVHLVRTPHSISLVDTDGHTEMISAFGWHENDSVLREIVLSIQNYINHWEDAVEIHNRDITIHTQNLTRQKEAKNA